MWPKNMSWKQIGMLGAALFGGFLFLIYKQQEKILYLNESVPPKRTSENPFPYANPSQHNLKYEDVWLITKDNLKLHAWWIPYSNQPQFSPTLLFFHANAGNMGYRLPNILQLHNKIHMNIFIISYRGYGESEGEPNEEGIKLDAQAAWEYLINKSDIDKKKIFIFGRSLGGAVAIYLTEQVHNQISGLIVENTFCSISDMVGKVFPWLNFEIVKNYMLTMHWKSMNLINSITCPILFLAGDQDEIVPHEQMLKLYGLATNAKSKKLVVISGGTHNDLFLRGGSKYWDAIKNFVQDNMMSCETNVNGNDNDNDKDDDSKL